MKQQDIYLKDITRKQRKASMESFHLDWLNDAICASLYLLEPYDFILRADLAVAFGVRNFNNVGLAFWGRRMGKTFAIIMACTVILFCIPACTMAVQSLKVQTACETISTCATHVDNLFKQYNIPDVEPVRTIGENGMKFINWYGVQELLSGRRDVGNFDAKCFGVIKLISGDADAGRGMTENIYLLDEMMFMKRGAVRTTMMNLRRTGTIGFCVSSEDPANRNPILERARGISDIASVSIFESICPSCRKAKLRFCMHNSIVSWNTNSRRLNRILDAILMGDGDMNALEMYGTNILQNGNAFTIPPYESIQEFYFDEPARPFQFFFAVIDPSTSKQLTGSFTAYVLIGMSAYERRLDSQRFNICYVSFFLFLFLFYCTLQVYYNFLLLLLSVGWHSIY